MANNNAQLDSDPGYREIRNQVVNKEFWSSVMGGLGSVLLLGGIALAYAGAPLFGATAALVAGGTAAVAGAGFLVGNFRRSTELQLDYEELNMRRRANYMGQVIEKSQGKADPALAMAMDAQLDNSTSRWRNKIANEGKGSSGLSAADVVSTAL